jgi:hypothetical protein
VFWMMGSFIYEQMQGRWKQLQALSSSRRAFIPGLELGRKDIWAGPEPDGSPKGTYSIRTQFAGISAHLSLHRLNTSE